MVKLLIRRSDGKFQRYNISAKNKRYYAAKKGTFYINHKRKTQKFYYSVFAKPTFKKIKRKKIAITTKREQQMERRAAKQKALPTYKGYIYNDVKYFTNVKQISTQFQIPDERGQIRLKIKAWKQGYPAVIVYGNSYIEDPPFTFELSEKMKRDAFSMAYVQIPYSPDGLQVLEMDYIYNIPINNQIKIYA
jgi:hypothetical protein